MTTTKEMALSLASPVMQNDCIENVWSSYILRFIDQRASLCCTLPAICRDAREAIKATIGGATLGNLVVYLQVRGVTLRGQCTSTFSLTVQQRPVRTNNACWLR